MKGTGVSMNIPYIMLVPDGTLYDMIGVQYGQASTYNPCFEGLPGQDIGPVGIKLIDDYGVPITGQSVNFLVSPRGSVWRVLPASRLAARQAPVRRPPA